MTERKFRKTQEIAEAEARAVNLKLLENYKGSEQKLKYECSACNKIIEKTPHSIQRMYGCHRCSYSNPRGLFTQEMAEKDAEKIGLILIDKYINANTKIRYQCKECGSIEFKIPNSARRGHGCYSCKKKQMGINKRLGAGAAGLNILFLRYKNGAAKRNLEFELTKDDLREIVLKNCYWCGITANEKGTIIKHYHKRICDESKLNAGFGPCLGVDRVDNDIGYKLNNCVPCCKICNQAKSNLSLSEWLNWINKIKNNNIHTIESIHKDLNPDE